jgi:hypothetical protein
VSSSSTVLEAGVILAEGEERSVKAEDLVLIKNRNGNQIMAVCRGVHATEKKRNAREVSIHWQHKAFVKGI